MACRHRSIRFASEATGLEGNGFHGAFEVRYHERGLDLTITDGPRSLVQFLMRLLKQLQALATAPAIDYEAYLGRFPREG